MIIKNEIELFTRVEVINQYNSLVNQLNNLGLNLDKLAIAETYSDDLFADYDWVDSYNQEYTYECLSELKIAFKKNTGAELELVYLEISELTVWRVSNFYIEVINPEVFGICKQDLLHE